MKTSKELFGKTAGGEDGGTNVALNRPVTASSNMAGWDPSRLTD